MQETLEDDDDDYDDSPEAMEAIEGSPEKRKDEHTPEVLQSQVLEFPDGQVPPPALPAAPVPAEAKVSSAPAAAAAVDGSDALSLYKNPLQLIPQHWNQQSRNAYLGLLSTGIIHMFSQISLRLGDAQSIDDKIAAAQKRLAESVA